MLIFTRLRYNLLNALKKTVKDALHGVFAPCLNAPNTQLQAPEKHEDRGSETQLDRLRRAQTERTPPAKGINRPVGSGTSEATSPGESARLYSTTSSSPPFHGRSYMC